MFCYFDESSDEFEAGQIFECESSTNNETTKSTLSANSYPDVVDTQLNEYTLAQYTQLIY